MQQIELTGSHHSIGYGGLVEGVSHQCIGCEGAEVFNQISRWMGFNEW